MAIILGNDVASFQAPIDWNTYKNNANFVIMKATEGNGFLDPTFHTFQNGARGANMPIGYYHFARPDLGNTPQAEAQWFLNSIGNLNIGEVLFLDYEVSFATPVSWCKSWLDYVHDHTNNTKGLIYLNQALATGYDWSSLVNAGYGLWIAAYTGSPLNNNYNGGSWGHNAKIQQWTNNQTVPGLGSVADGDVWFGDVNSFKAAGFQQPQPPPPPAPLNINRGEDVLAADLVTAICPPDDDGNPHTTYQYQDTDIVWDHPLGLPYRIIKV